MNLFKQNLIYIVPLLEPLLSDIKAILKFQKYVKKLLFLNLKIIANQILFPFK